MVDIQDMEILFPMVVHLEQVQQLLVEQVGVELRLLLLVLVEQIIMGFLLAEQQQQMLELKVYQVVAQVAAAVQA